MPQLFDSKARRGIIERLHRLQPDDRPRWGSLDAARMLAHLGDAFAITFDEKRDVFRPSFFSSAIGRWLVIYSPLPWPKGVKVPKVFFSSDPDDFERDRSRVLEFIERFAAGAEQRWGVSPGFGPLQPKAWARLSWRHCHHHLRQFGH